MRASHLRVSLVAAFAIACAGAPAKDPCAHLYGVLFAFVVDPAGELTHFEFQSVIDCRNEEAAIPISAAWKKTACAAFSMEAHAPTYGQGEEPRPLYSYFIYDADRPDVVAPRRNAGSSPDNPVVYVREEILDEHPEGHVCHGAIDPS